MDLATIFLLGVVALLVTTSTIGYTLEKKDYNNGRCPECDGQLHYFDTDSQGGRGYTCREHSPHYTTWVSWPGIDTHHHE